MRGVGAVDAVAAKWAARSAPDVGVARALMECQNLWDSTRRAG